ncbi:glutamine amidotransferase [Vogesella oryzae]|uniref:glutamine amidotransferase n=1 Tax=Vogesella oryzae TaxID=1735285 RepID=UPI001583CEE7|nr:glutamine amidotransferase [Vogesella oryzae]
MKQRLIIKTGEPHAAVQAEHGNFEHWIVRELGSDAAAWRVVDVTGGEALPAVAEVAGAIITGSPAMVSDRADWSEEAAAWLREAHAANVPLLGICFGHQLLAHALGGEVGYHPGGPEVGTVQVQRQPAAAGDALFDAMPPQFAAQALHWQSVLRLPPGATVLAANAFEPHHAFRVGRSWGVQFHPEFDTAASVSLIDVLTPALEKEQQPVVALRAGVAPTPEAATLLPRFAALLAHAG